MKTKIAPLIFIVCTGIALIWSLSSFPRVLILHSYAPSYSWTDSIDRYLKAGLENRQYIKHKFYYMDSKAYYNENIEKTSLRAVKNYNPDLIIAFDDNAQKLLSKYMDELPTHTKIIFAGVNGFVDKYNYPGKENITGIFERKPVAGAIFAINQFNQLNNTPDNKSLLLLTDHSTSSLLDVEILTKENWQDFSFNSKSIKTYKQWQEFITNINKDEIQYLLVAGYRKLTIGKNSSGKKIYADYKQVADWTQTNSPIPVIALNTFGAEDGFSFAIGSSAAEQANQPLAMMDKILQDGIKPIDIPYRSGRYYSVAINNKSAKKFNYNVPSHFYSFAEASNNIHD